MPFVIRHKETGEIVKMRSGKSVWAKVGHAKASWKTSRLDYPYREKFGFKPQLRKDFGFDEQDMFEIVEVNVETTVGHSEQMKKALHLLNEASFYCADDFGLYCQIQDFLKENK